MRRGSCHLSSKGAAASAAPAEARVQRLRRLRTSPRLRSWPLRSAQQCLPHKAQPVFTMPTVLQPGIVPMLRKHACSALRLICLSCAKFAVLARGCEQQMSDATVCCRTQTDTSAGAALAHTEEELAWLLPAGSQALIDRFTGLFRQLEPDLPARLPLTHRAVDGNALRSDVIYRQLTTSHARRLLSIARLNIARSRVRPVTCSLVRTDQTCFGRSGGFAPVSLPLLHGLRRAF